MRSPLRFALSVLALASQVHAETWTGVVLDPAGAPLAGVQVRSTRSSAIATTGPDGSWSLDLTSGIRSHALRAQGISWDGSRLHLDLAASQVVEIELLDAAGRKLGPTIREALPAGRSRIALTVPSGGANWISVRRGGERIVLSSRSRSTPDASLSTEPSTDRGASPRLAAAAADTLQYLWNGKVWRAYALAATPVSGRRDTLDVSRSSIAWRPGFHSFTATGLPTDTLSALRQIGDTLFAAVGTQIWSVPVTGGAWKLVKSFRSMVSDIAWSPEFKLILASLAGWGAEDSIRVWYRDSLGAWRELWSALYHDHYLAESLGHLWIIDDDGALFYRADRPGDPIDMELRGNYSGFAAIDSTHFMVDVGRPRYWTGSAWQYPSYPFFSDISAWWDGRAVSVSKLQTAGHYGLFSWTPGGGQPVRFPDSLAIRPTALHVAGPDLYAAHGLLTGASGSGSVFVGILHYRPGQTTAERIVTPYGFGAPTILGQGEHRLWVGSSTTKVGWLE